MEYIQQELQSITQFFYLGELESFSKAGGLANENYYVNTGNGKFVIKIIREHSASSVRTELPFFQRLREHNYPASFYLSSPKGECVFESNKLVAVAMHRVEGSAPIITIDTSLCLGRALAALHSIPTKGLKTRSAFLNDTYIPQCIDDLAKAVPQKDLSPYQIEYEKLAEFQSQYKLQKECIIHGDFSPKNCLFQGEELLSVIDWEEVSLGYPVLDLALTIFAVCFNESGFDDKLFVALLDG
ncbi:MAG: phosphotransferase [Pseudomonadales bacterium]|nr:phosphotransferase [Pseudomonadales bacterium]